MTNKKKLQGLGKWGIEVNKIICESEIVRGPDLKRGSSWEWRGGEGDRPGKRHEEQGTHSKNNQESAIIRVAKGRGTKARENKGSRIVVDELGTTEKGWLIITFWGGRSEKCSHSQAGAFE